MRTLAVAAASLVALAAAEAVWDPSVSFRLPTPPFLAAERRRPDDPFVTDRGKREGGSSARTDVGEVLRRDLLPFWALYAASAQSAPATPMLVPAVPPRRHVPPRSSTSLARFLA